MSSGFSTTGVGDGTEQADQAECGGVAAVILSAVEQRTVGARVLSARGDQREFVPPLAIDVEGCRSRRAASSLEGKMGRPRIVATDTSRTSLVVASRMRVRSFVRDSKRWGRASHRTHSPGRSSSRSAEKMPSIPMFVRTLTEIPGKNTAAARKY
jgi:hypothetical protein